jgi:ABC-type branched-subunit amino acid transport system ATPase component
MEMTDMRIRPATVEEPAAHPLLRLCAVQVRFGGIVAVQDVDLDLQKGEIRGLIGPNGAGKSTLFDVISGVRAPTIGSVHLNGMEITTMSAVGRARAGIRRTFQQVQIFGWLSVRDNVLVAQEWRGGGGGVIADMVRLPSRRSLQRDRVERAEEVLRSCGLWAIRETPAAALPTGHARMLELARAIVEPPLLLMLDEPASGLDHAEADRLAERVHAVREEHGATVLLVEHSMPFVMAHCDRITVLEQGAVLATGAPEAIASDDNVRAAYLGHRS